MPKTDIQILKALILRSRLLTDDRKGALLEQMPTMLPKAQKKLLSILSEESGVLTALAERTITDAVEYDEGKFFERLDAFVSEADKKLRKTEEGAERAQESEQSEYFFDDINT